MSLPPSLISGSMPWTRSVAPGKVGPVIQPFSNMDLTLVRDFTVALFIGVLVGIDREQRKHDPAFGGVGGLRTFILLAEAGALAAWLALRTQSPAVFMAGAVLAVSILGMGYWWHARTVAGAPGVTTLVAGLVVFLLGGAVIYGSGQLAVALAIVTSAVLAYREPLHRMVGAIGRDDLYAGLKLLAASFIVLPVVPNHPVDPWGALNPYKIWLLVVLISGLSLAGYVVARLLGPEKGTPLTGLAGGLVSSTVVTLEFARRSRQPVDADSTTDALAAGVLLAWSVMVGRVMVIVAAVYRPLLAPLLPGLLILGGATLVVALYWWRKAAGKARRFSSAGLPVKNPFNLTSALKFAGLFGVILVVVKVVEASQSGGGMWLVAVVAGLTDVDAITLSMSELVRGGGDAKLGVGAILVAALSNTLFKAGLVAALGSSQLRRKILVSAAFVAAAALVALAV